MNKMDLAARLSKLNGITLKKSVENINNIFNLLISILKEGKEIKIVGFGTFKLRYRKSRMGHLPISNKQVLIPEGNVLTFSPSVKLKKILLKT